MTDCGKQFLCREALRFRCTRRERFFALITDKAIRRGSFASVKQLVQRIDKFVTHHNTNSQPFQWTATADSILVCPADASWRVRDKDDGVLSHDLVDFLRSSN
jgi:hypothetical protein